MDWSDRLKGEIDTLRTARDELRVQLELGKAEARDLWDDLEKRWQHLDAKAQVLAEAGREVLDEVEDAGKLLVDEIRDGYRKLEKLL